MTALAHLRFAIFPGAARAARASFQWRLLVLWVLWMLIPTAIVSMPLWSMLGDSLDYSVHAADIAQRMDMTVFTDLMAQHGKHRMAFTSSTVVGLVATLLISPLLTAMAGAAARSPDRLGFGALTRSGLDDYPRMFRMLLWSIVPLGLAAALGSFAIDAADEHAAATTLASSADMGQSIAAAVMLLLLALAHATLDAGRAALVLERRRTSVIKAWWQGCGMLLRRPLASLGVYGIITVTGLAIAAALAVVRINASGASTVGFVAALFIVQVTVAIIGWMRSARLFALVDVARLPRA